MTHSAITIAEAVTLGAVASSLADWLFAGVLFHNRYQRHPGTWRQVPDERPRIIVTQLLAVPASAAMVAMLLASHVSDLAGALELATLIWLAAPLPILVANHLFIKIDHRITASHAAGWLIRLNLVAAIAIAAIAS